MAFINHYIYSFIFVICFLLLLLFYVILFVLNNKLYLSIYLSIYYRNKQRQIKEIKTFYSYRKIIENINIVYIITLLYLHRR